MITDGMPGHLKLSRRELERHVGSMDQLCGMRHYELAEGRARSTRAVDVDTGGGLQLTVLPDRGLDISRAAFRGVNLVYRGAVGDVHPAYYESRDNEWLRLFFGGLLTTCGLTHVGPPCVDAGETLGLHGRHSATPARQVAELSRWEGDRYLMELKGIVEDSVLFGPKVRLTRTIRTQMGSREISIRDTVENLGYQPVPFTIVYHVNPGYPLLDPGCELVLSSRGAESYNEHSQRHVQELWRCGAPEDGYRERDYLHTMETDAEGWAHAALVNPVLCGGVGLFVRFQTSGLPYLSEWQLFAPGEYVLGLEPCNVKVESRSALRERGTLPHLAPREERRLALDLGVLEGAAEIDAFRRRASAAHGGR